MRNPYKILGIEQGATDEQIEQARKYQLKLQCGDDANKQNEDGEYIQEVINQAASDLLNSEKRKEIDEEISKNPNILVPYESSFQSPSQIVMTKINSELIAQVPKIQLNRSIFDKKTKCKKLYLVVLESSNFLYAVEKVETDKKCWLVEYFTERTVSNFQYKKFEAIGCSWDMLEVFLCDNIPAIAYPAYQILPISIIKYGRVSDSALRAIHPIIQSAVHNMREELSELFEEYKVKSKGKI